VKIEEKVEEKVEEIVVEIEREDVHVDATYLGILQS